jgi:hypothetical protein
LPFLLTWSFNNRQINLTNNPFPSKNFVFAVNPWKRGLHLRNWAHLIEKNALIREKEMFYTMIGIEWLFMSKFNENDWNEVAFRWNEKRLLEDWKKVVLKQLNIDWKAFAKWSKEDDFLTNGKHFQNNSKKLLFKQKKAIDW